MKIAVFGVESWEKEEFCKAFPQEHLFFSSQKLSLQGLSTVKDMEVLVVFVNSNITSRVLGLLPRLKCIATMSTGYDHIDQEACQERGIRVCNVPTYGENTVAEHAMGLLLGLSRKLVQNVEQVRSGKFQFGGVRGFDLKGKTLGIIGGGHIGMHVACMARGFDMKVLVFDLQRNRKLARQIVFSYVSLHTLLRHADIVSLHIPYNAHTYHLINRSAIQQMKEGAYLINTSRGGVVDTKALLQALRSKKLAGAGLDVLEQEPKKGGRDVREEHGPLGETAKALLNMPEVLMTPHSGYNTPEALKRILQTTIQNIKGYKRGKIVHRVI